MEQLLLFDIDGTLFDPELFGKKIRAEFIKILEINEEELIRANADYYSSLDSSTDFDPREIVSYLATRFNKEREFLDEVFRENDNIYKESLFPEAVQVLSELSKRNALGIFSQGNEELQRRKIEASGINKFFKEEYIFIHKRKLSDEAIMLLPRNSTVIENKHDVAIGLKSYANVIWINRKSEDSDQELKTIHSLLELVQ